MSPVASLSLTLALLAKVTLVLLAGAALAALLRRQAAAARHEVWTLTLLAALALAPLAALAPPIPLLLLDEPAGNQAATALTPSPAAAPAAMGTSRAIVHSSIPERASAASLPERPVEFPRAALLLTLWVLGTAAVVLRALAGHLALRRLARAGTVLDSGDWPALLAETRALAGAKRPVHVVCSAGVATPLTWGTLRPVVVLPAGAQTWPRPRRRAALLHELAHVARRDALVQLAGTAACALYWFHPGVWMALRRLRREGEHACDDHVLSCGTRPQDYAAQLLEVARSARSLRLASPLAIGMARPSTLEGRLLAVLDETVSRRVPARAARLAAVIGVAAALVPLAGLTAVTRGASQVRPVPQKVSFSAAGADVRAPGCRTEGGDGFNCAIDVRQGETLELDLETGATVTIRGWDEPRVELHGRLASEDLPAMRAEMTRSSGGVRVRSWYTGSQSSWSSSHTFELSVPRRFAVRLESAGGDLTIEGVEGSFAGSTAGGDLVLQDLRGSAQLTTGGGTIRVLDSHLEGSVSTGGGKVTLSRVSGGLRSSSGSGPVVYSEPVTAGGPTGEVDEHGEAQAGGGPVHVQRAGGGIHLDEAPDGAVVSTGGGDIVVGRASGRVEASTGGGSIRVGPVAGSVRAGTGAGEIFVTLIAAGGEPQSVEVSSGHGRVLIELPTDFDGRVELESAYTEEENPTRIEAPWQLERSISDWSDGEGTPRRYVRASGTVGGGRGLLRVQTVNGDVIVRTGNAARSSVVW